MNRFSVIYLLRKQYYNIYCATHTEADTILQQVSATKGCTPIGIYDDKTELFYWEPTRQTKYDQEASKSKVNGEPTSLGLLSHCATVTTNGNTIPIQFRNFLVQPNRKLIATSTNT